MQKSSVKGKKLDEMSLGLKLIKKVPRSRRRASVASGHPKVKGPENEKP